MIRVPPLAYSVVRWSQVCHCSARTFRKFAQTAAELKLIECTSIAELKHFGSRSTADRLQIVVPKLLKYRDEWSNRSGVTRHQSRVDTDNRVEEEKETTKDDARKSASSEKNWIIVERAFVCICGSINFTEGRCRCGKTIYKPFPEVEVLPLVRDFLWAKAPKGWPAPDEKICRSIYDNVGGLLDLGRLIERLVVPESIRSYGWFESVLRSKSA